MAYVILRATKLKTMGNIGGSVAHTFRTRDTPNAVEDRTPLNEHIGATTPEAVKAGIAARLPEKRRSDAVLAIEYLIAASPEAFKDHTGGSKYFADALEWLRERHGAENVISAHIHRDERSPHMVAYVVPRDGEKLNAKKWLGGKEALSKMQTDFAAKVGKKYGLERGIEGSKAKHKTIQEFYGELRKAQDVEIPRIEAADLKPQSFKGPGLFGAIGLRPEVETPLGVAERLNTKIREAVKPVVGLGTKLAQVQAKERDQARAVAAISKTLADLREKVAPFLALRADQFNALVETAKRMLAENEKLTQTVQQTHQPRRGPKL